MAEKPPKPRPDFPLTPHPSGKWCKKIKGKMHYFGRWEDPDGAERAWDRVKHDLRIGRRPIATVDPNQLTVRELLNLFLTRKEEQVENGKLDDRTYVAYRTALQYFAKQVNPTRLIVDLHPADFDGYRQYLEGRNLGPHAMNREMHAVRAALRFGYKFGLIEKVVVTGDALNPVPVSVKRKNARAKSYLFTPAEMRKIVDHARTPLKAMILLGLNCGFYAKDCADLPRWAVDLDGAWLEFPRTKTEIFRACPLWPETVAALRDAIKSRPKARHAVDDELFFLTIHGNRWVQVKRGRDERGAIVKASRIDPVGNEFTVLLKSLKLKRKGVSFGALRKNFRTKADEVNDRNASLLIMGHAFSGMDEWYVKAIVRERLERVVNHVRAYYLDPK